MTENSETAHSIRYAANGSQAEIELDGLPIQRVVTRFSIDHKAAEVPTVYLELDPTAIQPIEVEALVRVLQPMPVDLLAAVREFLEPIDPDTLEQCVLAAMELGGVSTFGAGVLHVLRGWANGE